MKSLGRYEDLTEIGQGSMGIVYLGRDPNIRRQVAIKCLRQEIFGAYEGIQKRFQREILALGRLAHPNIVTIFDAGETATGISYIVMEYVEGVSLAKILKMGTPLTLDQIVRIGMDICNALDYAHSKGVIHRDIKPGNILLTSEQQVVKVTDFGIAHLDQGGYTQTGHILGTPQYMSPEQCQGKKVDGRSDLFSVGALLYELLTRQKPFYGDLAAITYQILTQDPAPPETLDIPKLLSDLVMKALKKDPHQRFATGAEMACALASLKTDQQKTIILTENEDAVSANRRRYGVWVATAVCIIAIISGLTFALQKKPDAPTPVEAVSAPQRGTVDFTSVPTDANLFINGKLKGVTPFVLDLPAGSYELVLKKDGYPPLEATIAVAAGEKVPVALKLTEKEGIP